MSPSIEVRHSSGGSLCAAVAELNRKYGPASSAHRSGQSVTAADIVGALEEFQECVRYLYTRRSAGAVLDIDSEADVQDAIYLMLRPWVRDLVHENPTDKVANRFAVKDFISRQARTVIDAKFVRDKEHARLLSRELHDDIEMYRSHLYCSNLIFFVYDPDSLIPDQRALREHVCVERHYSGVPLKCFLVVKP